MLKVNDLSVSFKNDKSQFTAVKGISFTLANQAQANPLPLLR
jgi:ABC-type dipeptide/oligopeptide/nickel transport system ATPase component